MKDALESAAVGRAADTEGYGNRKLIRPSLNRPDPPAEHRERPVGAPKKIPPPEQTHAENFYYQKQMQSKTPMVVVLHDGEEIQGVIEWYDRSCIKVNRSDGQPNLLIYKPAIKYMFKAGENGKSSS